MRNRAKQALSAVCCTLAASLPLGLATTASAEEKEPVAGKASYYEISGVGACGDQIDPTTEPLVAAPASLWTTPNPNEDPLCAQSIKVTYDGTTITVPIKDKCPSCDGSHIDLGRAAFEQLADTSLGVIDVEWEIVDGQ